MKNTFSKFIQLFFIFAAFFIFTNNVKANHAWGTYHWAHSTATFNLPLGDNLTPNWDPYLRTTSVDWSKSSILDTSVVPGKTTAKLCRPSLGRVEVCNASYGNNGWLGIAQIWVSGGHIVQGITKLNDTYFSTKTYNTIPWKNMVMCQEVGHNFGLNHQDENFYNAPLGSCMDYTSYPTPNQYPNAHDYEQLELIYSHLDTSSLLKSTALKLNLDIPKSIANDFGEDMDHKSTWGKQTKKEHGFSKFERDFGKNRKVFTFVTEIL